MKSVTWVMYGIKHLILIKQKMLYVSPHKIVNQYLTKFMMNIQFWQYIVQS